MCYWYFVVWNKKVLGKTMVKLIIQAKLPDFEKGKTLWNMDSPHALIKESLMYKNIQGYGRSFCLQYSMGE